MNELDFMTDWFLVAAMLAPAAICIAWYRRCCRTIYRRGFKAGHEVGLKNGIQLGRSMAGSEPRSGSAPAPPKHADEGVAHCYRKRNEAGSRNRNSAFARR